MRDEENRLDEALEAAPDETAQEALDTALNLPPDNALTLTPKKARTPFDDVTGNTAPDVAPPPPKKVLTTKHKTARTPFDDAAEAIAATERANDAEDAAAAEQGKPIPPKNAKAPISRGVRILAGIGVLLMIALTLLYTYSIATGAFLKW